MNRKDYFLATTEQTNNDNKVYPLFFVNCSINTIDTLVIVRPGAINKVAPYSSVDKINDSLVDNVAIHKFTHIPSLRHVEEDVLHDWDFDSSNERHVYMKVEKKDVYLYFFIHKYFIGWENQRMKELPVLGKPGWLCYPEEIRIKYNDI